MSNAWFYYFFPLVLATGFVIVGVTMFCIEWRWRDVIGMRRVGKRTIACGLFALVGGVLGLLILLTSPTPAARERLFDHVFRTPPERIERFVIKGGKYPDQYRPLTSTDVVIDDPARVRQIAEILRTAREVSPNHPHSKWSAKVEMVTRDGSYYFFIERTVPGDPNGTLVAPGQKERGIWHLGDWRADGLDKILEEAVNQAGASD